MRGLYYLSLLWLISLSSCNQHSSNKMEDNMVFDSSKWNIKEDGQYIFRTLMLDDVMKHVQLKGMSKEALVQKLGNPDRTDDKYLFYTIEQTYFLTLPVPVHTKTLVIKMDTLNKVEWRKIHE